MIFNALPLAGAYVVEMERVTDERGFFARSFDSAEFAAHGLEASLEQCSVSFNDTKGTLRGMHYQAVPHAETKLVRCTAGSIFDVIVDLRTESPTLRDWYGIVLSAENRRAVWIPSGVAHGFITLADAAEIYYMIGGLHAPQSARGIRWDDPAVGIDWPMAPAVISARDAAYPLLDAPARP